MMLEPGCSGYDRQPHESLSTILSLQKVIDLINDRMRNGHSVNAVHQSTSVISWGDFIGSDGKEMLGSPETKARHSQKQKQNSRELDSVNSIGSYTSDSGRYNLMHCW